jgi:putative nucleotidyltransferase with HDIG domain
MLIGLLLPVFEHVFHVTTDIRLLELSNQNLPLLRTLALEAPGTYQHSLMLGHLAEAAAEAIGADSLLARVGGYYHDIGKTKMPDYFIENQPKGYNRHDSLEPSMSASSSRCTSRRARRWPRRRGCPRRSWTPSRATTDQADPLLLPEGPDQGAAAGRGPGAGVPPLRAQALDPRQRDPDDLRRGRGASRTLIEPTPAKIRAMIQTIVDDCLRDGSSTNAT